MNRNVEPTDPFFKKMKLDMMMEEAISSAELAGANYEEISHSHCWTSETPPCGIEGKHRCCLCEKPVPVKENNYES